MGFSLAFSFLRSGRISAAGRGGALAQHALTVGHWQCGTPACCWHQAAVTRPTPHKGWRQANFSSPTPHQIDRPPASWRPTWATRLVGARGHPWLDGSAYDYSIDIVAVSPQNAAHASKWRALAASCPRAAANAAATPAGHRALRRGEGQANSPRESKKTRVACAPSIDPSR